MAFGVPTQAFRKVGVFQKKLKNVPSCILPSYT